MLLRLGETKNRVLCLAPELSEETFPTLLLISKLMKVHDTETI